MNKPGILLDTGPLVALLNRNDENHDKVKRVLSTSSAPFLTCEAVVSEACFLTRKIHQNAPIEIVTLGQKGVYKIPLILQDHWPLIRSILKKYGDRPISLADACLIALAGLHNEPRILTFDSDFTIYRWGKVKPFKVIN